MNRCLSEETDKYAAYPRYKDTGVELLPVLPDRWDVMPARRIFKQVRKPARPGDEQLAATQRYGVIPQRLFMEKEGQKVVLALAGTENFKHVEKNDFVISLRSFQGGIERCHYDGCVSPAYTVMRQSKPIAPGYFGFLLKSKEFISALQSVTQGIRDGKTITYEQFGSIQLPFPSIAEQRKIAAFLDHETARIDRLVAKQERLIELLKEKRQAVISHAVTKGLNPDAPMKDSGVEWLGEVPEHWEVSRIKYIATGFMYGTSADCNVGETGTPVLRIPNIKDGYVDFSDLKYAEFSPEEERRYLLKKDDILIVRTNGNPQLVGKSAIFKSQAEYIFASYLIKISPLPNVCPSFLSALMNSNSVREMLTLSARTSAGNYNMNIEGLSSTPIPLPPIDEQESIVRYIEGKQAVFEKLITKAEASVNLLQEHRTALISSAVTGKIDLRHWQEPNNKPQAAASAATV